MGQDFGEPWVQITDVKNANGLRRKTAKKGRFFAQSGSCHYNGPGNICFLATWYSALIATSITSAKLKNGILVYMVASVATFCSRQFFLLGQSLLLYSSVEWWPGASF